MHFQRVENALQRENATTLFSLSLLFPNWVTIVFLKTLKPSGAKKEIIILQQQ